jgi:hypothetical protein
VTATAAEYDEMDAPDRGMDGLPGIKSDAFRTRGAVIIVAVLGAVGVLARQLVTRRPKEIEFQETEGFGFDSGKAYSTNSQLAAVGLAGRGWQDHVSTSLKPSVGCLFMMAKYGHDETTEEEFMCALACIDKNLSLFNMVFRNIDYEDRYGIDALEGCVDENWRGDPDVASGRIFSDTYKGGAYW